MQFRIIGRWVVSIAALAFMLAVGLYAGREPILAGIGRQLVRIDPLVKSDAIVVLSGGTPQREIEGADLYVAGWAPRVIVMIERDSPAGDVLRARGIPFETQMDLKRRILRSLGVPDSAVTVLDHARATSTHMEAALIEEWVESVHARRIIVVTSPFHTARTSLVFSRTLRDRSVEVLVHPTSYERFDPGGWWKDREQLRNGIFEWQKALFYYVAYR